MLINSKLILYDKLGKIVYTKKLQKGVLNHSISMSNFSKGIYFLHLQSNNTKKIKKIIKQ